MRIISGELRGRRIKAAKGMLIRPTSDKIKGAIFNVLREKVMEARVLDLFAGTGNLAFEAISRGAASAVLVENAYSACQVIYENIKALGMEHAVTVVSVDAFLYLAASRSMVFDIIFLDPPYDQGFAHKAIAMIEQKDMLSKQGVIVAETGRNEKLNTTERFCIRKNSVYGDSQVWYLQRSDIE